MNQILFIFILLFTCIYSGELEDRKNIEQEVIKLFKTEQYTEISKLANKYLKTEERTDGGRWRLRYLYAGIYKISDRSIKDINYWNDLEKKHLKWIQLQPSEPTPHIAYANFLINKGWMYRGGDYAYNVPQKKWKLFKNEIFKATKYLIDHKDVAAKHPHWYAVMLNLAKLNGSNKIVFNALVNEALNKYPNYYSIYAFALYYMHPKWNNYSKEEIEKVAQHILKQTNDKEGTYARFYWMAKDVLKERADFDIDWNIMKKSIDHLIEAYPTQYNINELAYFTCSLNKEKLTSYYISKIKGRPNKKTWEGEDAFNICRDSINKKFQKKFVISISPKNLIDYMENYEGNKPIFLYLSPFHETDIIQDVYKIENIAKKYKDKFHFLVVYFGSKGIRINEYPNITKKYNITNLPLSLIIYKKRILLKIFDVMSVDKNYMSDTIIKHLENISKKIKNPNFLNFFKESIQNESSYVNTLPSTHKMIEEYLKSNSSYKAIAMASNMRKGGLVWGKSFLSPLQEEANIKAIENCEKHRKASTVLNECILYMSGANYIYDKNITKNKVEKKIRAMSIFNKPPKKITIDNKGTSFGVLETIDFEININNDIIEANMLGGILKGKDLENYTKTYLKEMHLCVGKDTTKRWSIETCSKPYPIQEYMTRNKVIPVKKYKFIIPRDAIGKELDKKWFILKIVSYYHNGNGYMYAHHRKDTLNKFLDK